MASVVLSFVGTQDPVSEKNNEEGSIVSLLRHLIARGNVIKQVFLLYTTDTAQRAQETKEWLASQPSLAQVPVQIIPTSEALSYDPTDLSEAAKEARRALERAKQILEEGDRLEFNASSGTPAMKSSFSVLQAAGYAPQSTVWQVRNPSEMKAGQTRVFPADISVLRREFELRTFNSQVANYNFDGAYDLFTRISDIAEHFAHRQQITSYLQAGKLWQRSKLEQFKNHIEGELTEVQRNHTSQWYFPAYEEAYLSIIRCRQGNVVEAFFHSFRAFEGIMAGWGKQIFREHIVEEGGKILLKKSIFDERDKFFANAKYKQNGKPDNDIAKLEEKIRQSEEEHYLLEFAVLCKFFRSLRQEYKEQCPEIKDLLTNEVSKTRNAIVHQLLGLQEEELYRAWGVENCDAWQMRILRYLNFIAQQSFKSWDEASLMAYLHQKLTEVIAEYLP